MFGFTLFYFWTIYPILFGAVLFRHVNSEDCTGMTNTNAVFVNTTDSIKFHVREHFPFPERRPFQFSRVQNGKREEICRFDIEPFPNIIMFQNCSSHYRNRTMIIPSRADPDRIEFIISMSTAVGPDNGTYVIFSIFSGQPVSEITVIPAGIIEGDTVIFECATNSTTVPETHNLTLQTTWFMNGSKIESKGRFIIYRNKLIMCALSKIDHGRVIACRATETMGLTTWVNTTLHVGWSPVPIPVLIPPNTFYHLDPGGQIPVINCYSECYPDCEMRWIKVDIQSTISTNGTLTLGKVQQNSSGEYSCHATWHGTDKTGRISVILLVKEDQVSEVFSQNYTPVTILGAVLGITVLSPIILIIGLKRRSISSICKTCSATAKEETAIAMGQINNSYEEFSNPNTTTPKYDDLVIGPNSDSNRQSGKDVYENTTVDK